ncbi:MAG: hypothetical protein JWN80_1810 [Microbacteriaceae bacterium]|nr:hypothetical protein [Microbacteriaceae bacterium]
MTPTRPLSPDEARSAVPIGVEASDRPTPRWRRPGILAGGVVVLSIAAVIAAAVIVPAAFIGTTHSESTAHGTSVATIAPNPSASVAAPTGTITPAVATNSIASFLSAVAIVDSSKADPTTQLAGIAAGAIVDEIANERQELTANGWEVTGTPTIASLSVVSETTGNPPTATVQACVDSSKVVTLDSDGKPLGTASLTRALNIYTLEYDAAGWKVVARTFPNNPTC